MENEMSKLFYELCKFEASGEAEDPSELLHEAVTNIMCTLIFGCR